MLDACGACGGVWVERANAFVIFGEGTGAGVAADLAALADRGATRRPLAGIARRCVDCNGKLVHRALYDVEVDACAEHGIWFDRGEVQAAVARMNAATFDEHCQRTGIADADAIVRRGALNAFLQALAER